MRSTVDPEAAKSFANANGPSVADDQPAEHETGPAIDQEPSLSLQLKDSDIQGLISSGRPARTVPKNRTPTLMAGALVLLLVAVLVFLFTTREGPGAEPVADTPEGAATGAVGTEEPSTGAAGTAGSTPGGAEEAAGADADGEADSADDGNEGAAPKASESQATITPEKTEAKPARKPKPRPTRPARKPKPKPRPPKKPQPPPAAAVPPPPAGEADPVVKIQKSEPDVLEVKPAEPTAGEEPAAADIAAPPPPPPPEDEADAPPPPEPPPAPEE